MEWKPYLAEFIGTMMMVMLGSGTSLRPVSGDSSYVSDPEAFGFAVLCLSLVFVNVSGAHFNPVISVGHLIGGKISVVDTLIYCGLQIVAGIAGAGLAKGLWGYSVPSIASSAMKPAQVLFLETVITFFLVYVHLGSAGTFAHSFGYGFSITLGHWVSGGMSRAGMNPARSFGSALVEWIWPQHWIYWLGPFMGGCLAALEWRYVLKETKAES